MTFEQLEYFIAVVRCDTFFDAAQTLHISQSALSKQIMKLEKELDIKLLDRSRRSASLTEAGTMFYQEALNLTREYRQALLRLRKFKEDSSLKLVIGTLPILSQYHLTAMLKNFADQNAHIRLSLEEVEEYDLLKGFSQGRYDLIITRSNMLDMDQYMFLPLAEDRLSAILPDNHPMAGQPSVSIHDIAHESFILMHPYTSIYKSCMELFHQNGIEPSLSRTARMESIISAVAVHEGVSLLPEGNFRLFQHSHITSVPVSPSQKLVIGVAGKKSAPASTAVSCFIRYLME